MRTLRVLTALLCALGLGLTLGGCKSKPPKPAPPPVVLVSMKAGADANPGSDGKASPIVLRLYQLKADAAFNNSDYFPLFDDEKKVLGQDLLSREEQELFPGQAVSMEIPFAAETRFIGVAGGYYDKSKAGWRAIAPASGSKGHSVHVAAVAERARVTVSVTP
jgi:type VI secretion system protein VasD